MRLIQLSLILATLLAICTSGTVTVGSVTVAWNGGAVRNGSIPTIPTSVAPSVSNDARKPSGKVNVDLPAESYSSTDFERKR
jgi:hypothetical protein